MTALHIPALRLNHVLGATAILLVALALWPWVVPPVPENRPLAARPASTPLETLAPLPALSTYAAVVERPLFTPSRRPPPGAASVLGPSIESRYRLLGVVATGARKKAFLADGGRHIEIAESEALDGWTVKEIGPDHVLLSSPSGETASLKLKPAAPEPPKPQ